MPLLREASLAVKVGHAFDPHADQCVKIVNVVVVNLLLFVRAKDGCLFGAATGQPVYSCASAFQMNCQSVYQSP
jgi:hypothetical protein